MALDPSLTEDIKECFEIFDKDKKGKLEKDMFGMVLRSMAMNPSEGEQRQKLQLPIWMGVSRFRVAARG